jgi:rhodanese-related sulfurtransferase
MKILFSLLAAFGCCAASSFAQEQKPPAVKQRARVEATSVTPDEAEKLIKDTPGLIILDVRSPEEFEHEHIKGAKNMNVHDAEFQKQVAELDQTKPVLIHCQSGRRSAEALQELAGKVAFPKVYHLPSGFKGWKDAKKPIEGKPLPGEGRLGPGKKDAGSAPR